MQLMFARIFGTVAAATLAAGSAAAAKPEIAATTKLEHCGARTCLLITGSRRDPASMVSVAGHWVAVTGGRRWRVSLPLEMVRLWSAPAARSIVVGLDSSASAQASAALPTGLLGQRTEFAFLDVRAR